MTHHLKSDGEFVGSIKMRTGIKAGTIEYIAGEPYEVIDEGGVIRHEPASVLALLKDKVTNMFS